MPTFNNLNESSINNLYQFKFTIRISHLENSDYAIKTHLERRMLENPLSRETYLQQSNDNIVYRVLSNMTKRNFSFIGNTNAFFADYEERSGSLIILFNVILITTLTNYGSIRETIDYFSKDIEALFEWTLNSSAYNVKVHFEEERNNKENNTSQNALMGELHSLKRKNLLNRVFVGVLAFALIGYIIASTLISNSSEEQLDTKIERKVKQEIRNYKIDAFFNQKLEVINDTTKAIIDSSISQ
jgi:hypothetical protein